MITRNKFIVVVKSDDAVTFANELAEVYTPGEVEPMSGQWLFFNNQGVHTAYLCDKPRLPSEIVPEVVRTEGDRDAEKPIARQPHNLYKSDVSVAEKFDVMYA